MKKFITALIVAAIPVLAAASIENTLPDTERLDRNTSIWNSNRGANPNMAMPKTPAQVDPNQAQTFRLRVTELDCQGCETRAQNAVRKVPGVRSVTADSSTGEVTFTVDDRNKVDETAVIRAIENEGFHVVR